MKQFAKSFLRLSLLLAIGAISGLQAQSCDECSDVSLQSCNTSCNLTPASCNTSCNTSCISTTTGTCGACHVVYIPRPTYDNTAYFWLPQRKDVDCDFNGVFELGFEYQQSFKTKNVAQSLFGSQSLHFQGSLVKTDPNAIVADYFGLSQFCDSTITFKPRIQNFNLHFQSYWGWDNWVEGLYGKVDFTFTHQKRRLNASTVTTCTTANGSTVCNTSCNTSCNTDCGDSCFLSNSLCGTSCDASACSALVTPTTCNTIPFPAGYMAATTVQPVPDIITALGGATPFGDMTQAWAWGRFSFCEQTESKVAGVMLTAGYNFWESDCGHFGAFFRYVAPTGNKPDPRYVFSPVVGNGHHHEVGGGISTHWELWNNDADQSLSAYIDGYVVTLLKSCQVRSFDFLNKGCLSRYMLLKQLTPDSNPAIGYDYAGTLVNGINFATRVADVKVKVKGDATLRFVYNNGGFNFGFGYNAFGQSKESLCLTNKQVQSCFGISFDPAQPYGFKGCRGVDCYTYAVTGAAGTTVTAPASATARFLNSTASNATITSCGTADNGTTATTNPATNGGTSICVSTAQANSTVFARAANAIPVGTSVALLTPSLTSAPAVAIANPLASVTTSAASAASGCGTSTNNSCNTSCNNSNGSDIDICAAVFPVNTTSGGCSTDSNDCASVCLSACSSNAVLDINSGKAPKQITHKGFATLDYVWADCDWSPYLGIGVEAEGAGSHASLQQWGVWVKGGIQF